MILYKIKVAKQPYKYIKKQPTNIQDAFIKWKKEVVKNPYTKNDGKVNGNFYKGCQSYKKRFGKFRIAFIINDNEVLVYVYQAKSRGQIYRNLKK